MKENDPELRKIRPKLGFAGDISGKESAANAGDLRYAGLIPGSGRCPEGGRDNLLQYSCLENPMDRGAWQALVHSVTQN